MSVRPLSGQLQEAAVSEVNEVPKRLQEDINYILEWVQKQPHLNIRMDPQWIVAFLRGNKFDFEKTKKKLDMFYTMRAMVPEIFANRNPSFPEIQGFFKRNILVMLPNETNVLAPSRCLLIAKNADPNHISVLTSMKAILVLADVLMYEDDVSAINGQEAILDLEGIPYNYISQLTPTILKTIALLMQSAYPVRVKALRFINVPSFLQVLLNTFLSLLSKKINSRVHFYVRNNLESLHSDVPKSVLPEEYGGSAGSISELSNTLLRKLESYDEWFQEDSKFGTDESKRPVKPKNANEFFGMEGTFRKLEFD